jgi:hypothetical protein
MMTVLVNPVWVKPLKLEANPVFVQMILINVNNSQTTNVHAKVAIMASVYLIDLFVSLQIINVKPSIKMIVLVQVVMEDTN